MKKFETQLYFWVIILWIFITGIAVGIYVMHNLGETPQNCPECEEEVKNTSLPPKMLLEPQSAVLDEPDNAVKQVGVLQTVFYNYDSKSLGWVIRTNAFPVNTTITACKLDDSLCADLEVISRVDNDTEASVPLNIFREFKKTGGVIELILYFNDEFPEGE